MTGSNQSKKSHRQNDRLGPTLAQGSSRVSKVVGGGSGKSERFEQRSTSSSTKQGSRGQNQPTARRAAGTGKARAKKGSSSTPNKSTKASPSANNGTADSRVIDKARNVWGDLEPHHQQRVLGILLLFLSLFLFAVLTIFSKVIMFSAIDGGFLFLFGWGAYPLSLGLIVFAVAHLVEGIRNRKLIRWSLVVGLVILWLIVLAESRLLLGGLTGGVLASLLARPLQGWPAAVGHILLIGLFVIVTIIAFQITVGHVLAIARAMGIGTSRKSKLPDNTAGPSPFLGQRPRFSRYANSVTPLPLSPSGPSQSGDEEEGDEQDIISFEPDFGEDDDPLNDINVLKQQVGNVPRGARSVPPINVNEHSEAVQGASQRPLPFNQQAKQADNEKRYPTLEPLSPNPLRKKQPRAANQVAVPATPISESPWKVPDTTLLNNPEEVKLQLFGDDTATLAKTIQDTLRSFRVDAEVRPEDISIGPTIIRFGIRPTGKPEMKQDTQGKYTPVRDAGGNIIYGTRTRVSRIMALQNDLALVLEAKTIRMEAPVPGRPYVGVEIPNKNSRLVTLREVLESKEYQAAKAKSKLAIALGKDVAGLVRVGDLARMPHLLIAGATGAGKCLAYDEPVFLADGRVVKVQELVGQSAQVIGVIDTQTMQQTPVNATFTENGSQEVFEITLDNGIILRRTAEHPLWAAHLDENQHVGRQPNGKASRRTRAIDSRWVQSKDLQVCGNRPNFDGHVILCPLAIQQQGTVSHSADCPQGYEWRKIVSIRRSIAPTVNIEVHSDNHAFVGYAVEHNSVCINTIIASVLTQATPDDVRLLMVDPKMVELNMYAGIPHLLSPVVTEVEKVVPLLRNAITEMERRYRLFSQLGVRNLDGYRKLRAEKTLHGDDTLKNLPAIVIIIDELADLMMAAPEEVEGMICRLAQLARATGIHLVVATQRPSVDVITGLIKANIPTRISFMVSSSVDSRTIIDMGGAERLLGRGDMLYLPADAGRPERIQGSFLADEEAESLVLYWRQQVAQHLLAQRGGSVNGAIVPDVVELPQPVEPGWEIKENVSDDFELDDDLLDKAEEVIREYGRASISLLQRRLRVGYSRAARLIDLLEERGIIGHSESAGRSREVLGGGEGRTMADEVEDIVADERAREEALKKHPANNQEP